MSPTGTKSVFIAGHAGMVGAALTRKLANSDRATLITASRRELDLTNQSQVMEFFDKNSMDEVYLAAGRVGGIHANNRYPAEFIYENLMIEANIIHAAHENGVQKLLFLGSSCIYPKFADQPITESSLLTGELEPTNEPYAIAKIAGIKLCESYNRQHNRDYRCVMPTNLYGPHDNFHPKNSHVIPALIQRFHNAKERGDATVTMWGSGMQRREFLHVDDLADACFHVMNMDAASHQSTTSPMSSHINVGTGTDCTIAELAQTIARIVGFKGELVFDSAKPDGTPRKLLDIQKLRSTGWSARYSLESGLRDTYKWYIAHRHRLRA